jgi:hypothetical protein
MSDTQDTADMAAAFFFEKAAQRFNALLAEHDAMHPQQLSDSESADMLERAIVETAADFPGADLDMLRHGVKFLTSPAFSAAFERMKLVERGNDVFEPAKGVDCAVVLAGLGLPVAPYNLDAARIMGEPTNDIDAVFALFMNDPTAAVGYDACAAPFYLFVTDCVRTLRQRVANDPKFFELELLFERGDGASLPPDPGRRFKHAIGLFPRRPGDTISAVGLIDPDPAAGSIVLQAGWKVGGDPYGAPSDGYFPIPLWLVHAAIDEPEIACAFWPLAAPASLN